MSGPTGGPWKVVTSDYGNHRCRVQTENGVATIATVHALIHQRANGRLIAAAPDLLDALKGLMDLARAGNWVAGVPMKGDDAIAKAEAAIAKADPPEAA